MHFTQAQPGPLPPVNCATDFFTITVDGYIQQWSLAGATVTGGDTVLSGGGTSLGYCGNGAPTFFSNSYAQIGIIYYDTALGWINIPTYTVVNNNGGYLNDQYYMVEGAVIQVVKYWDGVNLVTVDSLNGEFFAGTQDIAVDTLGQAWVFTGPVPSTVDSLKVYDQNGLITAYAIQFNEIAYGSFFLNGTLYLGTDHDSIYQVIISGTSAMLGNPIPFDAGNFTDMAGCQQTGSVTSIAENPGTAINIFSNPTHGLVNLPRDIARSQVSVINAQGQYIQPDFNGQRLDLTRQPPGMYFIRISGKGVPQFHRVIKL